MAATVFLIACSTTVPPQLSPSPSPSPEVSTGVDAEAATAALTAYMMDVAAGNFARAWVRLSPATQAAFGSEEAFAAERAAYMQSAGGIYRLATPAHDLALLAQWASPDDPAGPPLARAFIAQVDYPRLSDNPAGFEILVAAPDASGEWLIWKVR